MINNHPESAADSYDYWPCKIALSSPGYLCEWRSTSELKSHIEASGLTQTLDMTTLDLVKLVLHPITFGAADPAPASERLASIAAVAGIDPQAALICMLAEHSPTEMQVPVLDLPSAEVDS